MPAAAPPAEVLPQAPAAEASAAAPAATAVASQVPAPAAESAAETPAAEAKSTDVPAAAPSEAPAAVQMKAAASLAETGPQSQNKRCICSVDAATLPLELRGCLPQAEAMPHNCVYPAWFEPKPRYLTSPHLPHLADVNHFLCLYLARLRPAEAPMQADQAPPEAATLQILPRIDESACVPGFTCCHRVPGSDGQFFQECIAERFSLSVWRSEGLNEWT